MRVVLKIGTSSLIGKFDKHDDSMLSLCNIASVVETACRLRRKGHEVVLVASGAVGAGCHRSGLGSRPSNLSLATKQALAAIGQVHLMGKFDSMFDSLGVKCAQVLLTYENLRQRDQYLNARNTFEELLALNVIPIVNENDTVAVQELKFGDNDRLSAMVASLINADSLYLLTDVDGLFSGNPNVDASAKLIRNVCGACEFKTISDALGSSGGATSGSGWGTGGMYSKVSAAELATASGVRTVVMHVKRVSELTQEGALDGGANVAVLGTYFAPNTNVEIRGRKRWVQMLPVKGEIAVNDGATRALARRKSLFAAGVVGIKGNFMNEECVRIVDAQGARIGCGVSNYTSNELLELMGKRSEDFSAILGYHGPEAVVDRQNLVTELAKETEGE